MAEPKAVIPVASVGVHKGVRVLPVQTVLVEFTDKEDGTKKAKLAVILGEEVRFILDSSLSGPVQDWLSKNILIAAGTKDS